MSAALCGAILLPVLGLAAPSLRAKPLVALGVMNKNGVTKYKHGRGDGEVRLSGKGDATTRAGVSFYSADPGHRANSEYEGATDLADNVSWGWHHPNGVYNTIPVGAPLIDSNLNIYLGSDDAIRKFSVTGDLLWSYAPRGQLAAAPALVEPSGKREAEGPTSATESVDQEEALMPSWLRETKQARAGGDGLFFKDVRVGDLVKVKPGMGFDKGGMEYYRAGDVGMISSVYTDAKDQEQKTRIHWARTGTNSIAQSKALSKRFLRVNSAREAATPMLVGSTTSGYVFAIDLAKGEELWATQACDEISGVKGVVSSKAGVVLVATNRCTDRYCYRYRNITNPLAPGNSVVRALSAADGSNLWEFKPESPVWNFVPQYHATEGTVMFSDYEGTIYSLGLQTGKAKWTAPGTMGTYTQASAVYYARTNQVFGLGVKDYDDKHCNPYPAPGILPDCGTWPGKAGWVRGYNASSGLQQWETETWEPPSSATVGMLNSPMFHTRLVIGIGHNCWYGSKTQLWALDPHNGHDRFYRTGPTLWTGACAGDKEGGDIRRAMGGRAACYPGAWTTPVIDSKGDIYIGNQVGELQRYGTLNNKKGSNQVKLISTLKTGVAFQDNAIAFAPGIMAVATCTSLIVFQTADDETPFLTTNKSTEMEPYWDKKKNNIDITY